MLAQAFLGIYEQMEEDCPNADGQKSEEKYARLWKQVPRAAREVLQSMRNVPNEPDFVKGAEFERMVIQYREKGTITEALFGDHFLEQQFERLKPFLRMKHTDEMEASIVDVSRDRPTLPKRTPEEVTALQARAARTKWSPETLRWMQNNVEKPRSYNIMKIGDYELEMLADETHLCELSEVENAFQPRTFQGERIRKAPRVCYLGVDWDLIVGTIDDRIYKLSARLSTDKIAFANEVLSDTTSFLSMQLGAPEEHLVENAWMWRTQFGNVVLDQQSFLDSHTVNLHLTSGSLVRRATLITNPDPGQTMGDGFPRPGSEEEAEENGDNDTKDRMEQEASGEPNAAFRFLGVKPRLVPKFDPYRWQEQIIEAHPNVGVAGTRENESFVAAYKCRGTPKTAFEIADELNAAGWPILIPGLEDYCSEHEEEQVHPNNEVEGNG